MKLLKSPIFYMGNKYKLLPQLLPLFPKNIDTFYDMKIGFYMGIIILIIIAL